MREVSPAALFPEPPLVRFVPEHKNCTCSHPLHVQKTRQKNVRSMTGPFVAHETLLLCKSCNQVYASDLLLGMVPSGSNVGFDVLVFVGQSLFKRYRTLEEVQSELLLQNVSLSISEIAYLGRKFIFYLALGHAQVAPAIRQKMQMAGGYVLHIDATHEGDAPTLMSAIDSLSKFVLANIKLPGEKAEHIIPFLQNIQNIYGQPTACVRDMGTGISKAIKEVFPGLPDFICHFHFLRDIGKDLLEPAYSKLRNLLRKHAATKDLCTLVRQLLEILRKDEQDMLQLARVFSGLQPPKETVLIPVASAYTLANWALQGKKCGHGYGFPFDRPLLEFAERILQLDQALPELVKQTSSLADNGQQELLRLIKKVSQLAAIPELHASIEELRWRTEIFDDLRKAMRIALEEDNKGLNDEGCLESMSTIRQEVETFRSQLENNPHFSHDNLCQKMGQQIDKYHEKLFADPITVKTPNGPVTVYPQRTNNIIEQLFRFIRNAYRRKTGNNSLRRPLRTMLADTPLVKNLDNPEYMELLLNGNSNLEELFAALHRKLSIERKTYQDDSDKILSAFRSVIKQKDLPGKINKLLTQIKAQAVKSN
ncbi:MAG: transposase [Desulfovibrionales bacterium]|nr:transposase [Desulfovibrionales bacterium]